MFQFRKAMPHPDTARVLGRALGTEAPRVRSWVKWPKGVSIQPAKKFFEVLGIRIQIAALQVALFASNAYEAIKSRFASVRQSVSIHLARIGPFIRGIQMPWYRITWRPSMTASPGAKYALGVVSSILVIVTAGYVFWAALSGAPKQQIAQRDTVAPSPPAASSQQVTTKIERPVVEETRVTTTIVVKEDPRCDSRCQAARVLAECGLNSRIFQSPGMWPAMQPEFEAFLRQECPARDNPASASTNSVPTQKMVSNSQRQPRVVTPSDVESTPVLARGQYCPALGSPMFYEINGPKPRDDCFMVKKVTTGPCGGWRCPKQRS